MGSPRDTSEAHKAWVREGSHRRRLKIDEKATNPLHHMLLTIINSVDMSANEMAAVTGVSKSVVCDLRNGKKLGSLDSWNKIIVGLGVEVGHRYK